MPSSLLKPLAIGFIVACLSAAYAPSVTAEECCECGCSYQLKKVYRPVVTFKECTFQCWDYTTVCKDVLAPTSTCTKCQSCGGCDGGCDVRCSCPGPPKLISVPVAVPCKCRECVRKVPVVTWVCECKCEKCCNKCKHHHKQHHSIHRGCGCK